MLFELQISIALLLVMPLRQYFPLDVKTSLFLIKKRFVELQVLILPLGSFIIPSSKPSLLASILASIQLSLLRVL